MSKTLLQEYAQFEYESLKDENGKPKLSRFGNRLVRGIIQRANALNQNGRIYPKGILEREVRNYMNLVSERRATGELDHADSPVVNLKNVSHVITDIWWKGDDLWGEIEVLTDMDEGKNLEALFKNEIKVGISSRALGSVQKVGEANMVQDDLYLVCWDIVSEPSTHGAFLNEGKIFSDEEVRKIIRKSDRLDRIVTEVISLRRK